MKPDSLSIASLYSQENRLFRLDAPLSDDLLLDRFEGCEGLSMPFQFTLQLISERADLTLKDLMGQELGVRLATAAGERRFSGRVVHFAHTGSDGGFAFYRAVLGPWTDFLRHRVNCRIFHGLTLPELLEKLFAEYGARARYQMDLDGGDYPPVTQVTQYRRDGLRLRFQAPGGPGDPLPVPVRSGRAHPGPGRLQPPRPAHARAGSDRLPGGERRRRGGQHPPVGLRAEPGGHGLCHHLLRLPAAAGASGGGARRQPRPGAGPAAPGALRARRVLRLPGFPGGQPDRPPAGGGGRTAHQDLLRRRHLPVPGQRPHLRAPGPLRSGRERARPALPGHPGGPPGQQQLPGAGRPAPVPATPSPACGPGSPSGRPGSPRARRCGVPRPPRWWAQRARRSTATASGG